MCLSIIGCVFDLIIICRNSLRPRMISSSRKESVVCWQPLNRASSQVSPSPFRYWTTGSWAVLPTQVSLLQDRPFLSRGSPGPQQRLSKKSHKFLATREPFLESANVLRGKTGSKLHAHLSRIPLSVRPWVGNFSSNG